MSASYHGYFEYKCYNDCEQAGCPGHHGRLVSKHGSYYIERIDPTQNNKVLGRTDLCDIGMFAAAAKAWNEQ